MSASGTGQRLKMLCVTQCDVDVIPRHLSADTLELSRFIFLHIYKYAELLFIRCLFFASSRLTSATGQAAVIL